MSLLQNSNAISSGGYDINNSLRFRKSSFAYLNKTPATTTNRRTYTFSAWIKKSDLGYIHGENRDIFGTRIGGDDGFRFYFTASDTIDVFSQVAGTIGARLTTTQVFRDPSAWYHIMLVIDTTSATAGNRMRLYVNGSEITAFTTDTQPSQNYDTYINTTNPHGIGVYNIAGSGNFDGYMTEVNFVDGQALTPSSFGETDPVTGSWVAKKYTGTYGTNGFYLTFSDTSALTTSSNVGLGKDFSGNGNYWATNNISITAGTTYDAMTDSPTLTSATVANYAVLNPLYNTGLLEYFPLSNGNLTATESSGSAAWRTRWSTIGMTSGKWYAEFTLNYAGTTSIATAGTAALGLYDGGTAIYVGQTSTTYGYLSSAVKYNNASSTAYGATYANGDIIGIAFDASAGTLTFYKNGTTQGTAYTSIPSGLYYFACSAYWTSPDGVANWHANFGQRPFAYTPPTGYVALNTYNLPTPTILRGNKYMDAVTYTGNGVSGRAVNTTTNFRPDFAWGRARNVAGGSNILIDSNRGNTKYLISESIGAEGTATDLTFTSTGITWNDGASINGNGSSYVTWFWQAGQGTNTTNTAGTITSTVSVNATAGFSVVTYTGNSTTGATVGHGLGVTPSMIMLKSRSFGDTGWAVKHKSLSSGNNLRLNSTAVQGTLDGYGVIADLNSATTFTLTSGGAGNTNVNNSSSTYVAYCWAEIAGFSKFGGYTGTGSTNGPFIYTGFRPRWIMLKTTSQVNEWLIIDTTRNTYNISTNFLSASSSVVEGTAAEYDILSNGFKLRSTNGGWNGSSETLIYAAFAENPFKNSNAR